MTIKMNVIATPEINKFGHKLLCEIIRVASEHRMSPEVVVAALAFAGGIIYRSTGIRTSVPVDSMAEAVTLNFRRGVEGTEDDTPPPGPNN